MKDCSERCCYFNPIASDNAKKCSNCKMFDLSHCVDCDNRGIVEKVNREAEVKRLTKEQRLVVYGKYNGRCAYCGCVLPERWHVDHLEPVVRNWGDKAKNKPCEKPENNNLANVMPACPQCNIAKGSMPLESWRAVIKGHIKSLNRQANYRVAKAYGLLMELDIEVMFYFEEEALNEHSRSKSKTPASGYAAKSRRYSKT